MKKLSAKKWIISLFSAFIAVFLILSLITYIVDPFFQFRTRDNSYVLKERYVCEGLIKNYDYDALLIGSSLTQNFDMELYRELLGGKPLHVGVGGLNETELIDLLALSDENEKLNRYYICVDLYMYAYDAETESKLPDYLMKDDIISRLKYIMSYESWFRFMPMDIAFLGMKALGVNVPENIAKETSIDNLENWEGDFPYGEKAVLDNFKSGSFAVSEVDTNDLYNKMKERVDAFFSSVNFKDGAEYVFFFPPYSSLYWANAQNEGYYDIYLQLKEYYYSKVKERGFIIFDFQGAEFTKDLSYYRDTTHFSKEINDLIIKSFADGSYLLTDESFASVQKQLDENTLSFRNGHSDLF